MLKNVERCEGGFSSFVCREHYELLELSCGLPDLEFQVDYLPGYVALREVEAIMTTADESAKYRGIQQEMLQLIYVTKPKSLFLQLGESARMSKVQFASEVRTVEARGVRVPYTSTDFGLSGKGSAPIRYQNKNKNAGRRPARRDFGLSTVNCQLSLDN